MACIKCVHFYSMMAYSWLQLCWFSEIFAGAILWTKKKSKICKIIICSWSPYVENGVHQMCALHPDDGLQLVPFALIFGHFRYFNPRQCMGGGHHPWVFWNGRRTAWRIALKFCIAYGTSSAQLLTKNWPEPCLRSLCLGCSDTGLRPRPFRHKSPRAPSLSVPSEHPCGGEKAWVKKVANISIKGKSTNHSVSLLPDKTPDTSVVHRS